MSEHVSPGSGLRELNETEVNTKPLIDLIGDLPASAWTVELDEILPYTADRLNTLLEHQGSTPLDRQPPKYAAAVVERDRNTLEEGENPNTAVFILSGILGSGPGVGDFAPGAFAKLFDAHNDGAPVNPSFVATVGSSVSVDTSTVPFETDIHKRAAYQAALISKLLDMHPGVTDVYVVGLSLAGPETLIVSEYLNELRGKKLVDGVSTGIVKGVVLGQSAGQYTESLAHIAKGVPSVMSMSGEKKTRFPTPDAIAKAKLATTFPADDNPLTALYAERDLRVIELAQERAYRDIPELKTLDDEIVNAQQENDFTRREVGRVQAIVDRRVQALYKKRAALINAFLKSQEVDKRPVPIQTYTSARHILSQITDEIPNQAYAYFQEQKIPIMQYAGLSDQYFSPDAAFKNVQRREQKQQYVPDVFGFMNVAHGDMTADRYRYGARIVDAIMGLRQYPKKGSNKSTIFHHMNDEAGLVRKAKSSRRQ